MKLLFSAFGGALTLTEDKGVFTLSGNEELGGGAAKGIIKGQFSLVIDGPSGLRLGEALLNAHIPANLQPLAIVVEGIVNQAVTALE